MKPSPLSHFSYDLLRHVQGDAEATAIARALLDHECAVVAVEGPAGVGKTTLVRMLATRFDQVFPSGVHWILPGYGPIRRQIDVATQKVSEGSLTVIDGVDIFGEAIADLNRLLNFASGFKAESSVVVIGQDLSALKAVSARWVRVLDRAGSGVIAQWMQDSLANGVSETCASGTLERPLLGSFLRSGLVGTNGEALATGSNAVASFFKAARTADRELIARIRSNPDIVYELSPRKFEEIVAHVYQELGYDVSLTPAMRDGGRDLHVARKDHLGSFLFFVECKRYSKERPVGVGLIRQLFGVVAAEQASAGVMVTTSSFTAGAKAFQETVPYRLSLREFGDLQHWLTDSGF